MPDSTGRWVNRLQWQCPKCAWVNGSADATCQKCEGSVRPSEDEPARPWGPLDLIGRDVDPVELATKNRVDEDERG